MHDAGDVWVRDRGRGVSEGAEGERGGGEGEDRDRERRREGGREEGREEGREKEEGGKRKYTEHGIVEQAIVEGELLSGLVFLGSRDESPVRGLLRRFAAVVGDVGERHLIPVERGFSVEVGSAAFDV